MSRTPAYLAAVASSAVPGLDPVVVRAHQGRPGNRCDVAFVTDTQRRAWVVRVPTTPAVGAQLDTAADLLPLLSRRVPYAVPSPRGFATVREGRAVVYPFLHGRSVRLDEVTAGPGISAEIGRAVAALHNVDRGVFDEAGVAVYDADTCRMRHLADLDRAAATGHVPTALLARWERVLEDVSVWKFAPTPTHGDLGGGRVLVTFTDENDAATGSVRAITGWEHARVADPADDFAVLAAECSPEALESIVEAYSVARVERPDRQLRLRARLASELRLLARLLDAVTAEEPSLITHRAAELRELDVRTADLPPLVPVGPPAAEPRVGLPVATRPPAVTSTTPPSDDALDAPAAPDEDLGSDHTQLLKVGDAAEETTVIPDDELTRLRADRAAEEPPADADGPDEGTENVTEQEREQATQRESDPSSGDTAPLRIRKRTTRRATRSATSAPTLGPTDDPDPRTTAPTDPA